MNNLATVNENGEGRDDMMTQAIQASGHDIPMAIQAMSVMCDRRISTARAYPRSITRFKKEAADLLREDVATARSAEYAKPVGGDTVKGPSVRLAELAVMCWTNIEVRVEEPIVTEKSVSVKASAWDLERNILQESVITSSIIGKTGRRYPQHLIETICSATAAKANRNAVFKVIPKSYINFLLGIAKEVAAKNEKPLNERRSDMLSFMARSHKVQPEQVFAFLGVAGESDITTDNLDDIRAILNGIKDGESTIADVFPAPRVSALAGVLDKLKDRQNPVEAEKSKDEVKFPETEKAVAAAKEVDKPATTAPVSTELPGMDVSRSPDHPDEDEQRLILSELNKRGKTWLDACVHLGIERVAVVAQISRDQMNKLDDWFATLPIPMKKK